MDPRLEGKVAELGKFLAENGPGILRVVAALARMFPSNTQAFRLGERLGDVISHLP